MKKLLILGLLLLGGIAAPPLFSHDGTLDAYSDAGQRIRRANGHDRDREAVLSGNVIQGIFGRGFNGSAFTTSDRVSIELQANQNWTTTANGTKILFKTTPDGATTPATVMTIDDDGNTTIAGVIASSTNTYSVSYAGQTIYHVLIATSLADTQQLAITQMAGKAGGGSIIALGHASAAQFSFSAAGVVTLGDHTNCSTTDDNDTTLNIFDSGTTITIENQLGATYTLLLDIWYIN